MKRIEFTLSMPGRSSWDGGWSGQGNHYAVVRTLPDAKVAELAGRSWSYSFGDGWIARVDTREVPKGEHTRKSDGFCGYDWMVTSILERGRIETGEAGR